MFKRESINISTSDRKRNIPQEELINLEEKVGQVKLYEQEGKLKIYAKVN